MNRRFDGVGPLIAHLEQVRGRYTHGAVEMLNFIVTETAHEVESMIGEQQEGWPPLADSTVKQKEYKGWGKNGDPNSPLWATGHLHDSIEHEVESAQRAAVGTNVPYAVYLEYGTLKMPPRSVFLPAGLKGLKERVALAAEHFARGLGL